jgi:hypothetical protein
MPDAPLSTIGCTRTVAPPAACTLPCTLSSADGSVRAPRSCSGGSSLGVAASGVRLPDEQLQRQHDARPSLLSSDSLAPSSVVDAVSFSLW